MKKELLSLEIIEKWWIKNKTDTDFSKIVEWSTKASQSDNQKGCFRLAYAREHGQGIQKNWREASDLYQKIEDSCHVSKLRRSLLLFNGGHGLTQDYQSSFRIFDELYNTSDTHRGYVSLSCDEKILFFYLAKSYYYGLGTDVNLEKTYEILKKNPHHNLSKESNNLYGLLMFNPNFKSLSDEKKYSEGIYFLKKGASLKEPNAIKNLEILQTTIGSIQFERM